MTLFAALFSHYRRHPLQLLALALMIVLATTLWTGVHHLTDRARVSLAESERAVAGQQQLIRDDGQPVTVQDFANLRRAGLCVMPWLEVRRPSPAGRVIGVDPFSAACFGNQAPGQAGSDALNGEPFLDIGEAAQLSADGGEGVLSLLVPQTVDPAQLPPGYQLRGFSLGPATGELGESFLLNLDALGGLVLLITALLVRSVYQLGLVQRRESFALLTRFGVPGGRVWGWLLAEMAALTALCVVPGLWLGRWLAALLGSGFGAALENLFDSPLYAVGAGGVAVPALVMSAVVLAACFADRRLLRYLPAARYVGTWPAALMGLVAGQLLVGFATVLGWLFAGIALVFVAVGVLTPRALAGMAQWRASAGEGLGKWRRRELAVVFRRLALPVVALQFAVAMVLAVQALVSTFENTFEVWLGQRLEAEFYVEVSAGVAVADGVDYLDGLAGLGDWHLVQRGRAQLESADGTPALPQVDLFAISPVGPLVTGWTLLVAAPDAWARLAAGEGVMVNEQLARRQGYEPGGLLTFRLDGRARTLPVLGVYADYGRPAGEILTAGQVLPAAFQPRFVSFSINPGALAMDDVRQGLAAAWGTEALMVRDNQSIQTLASGVFDQTFLLTRAITVLTLVLAGASLLIMGWVFFTTRVWYYRLLSVWGLTRREAANQLRWLAVALTGCVALVALPLGVWLTWVLVARINPLAFGWSLPMAVYPGFWLEMLGWCLLIGVVISLLMGRQLRGLAPAPAMANVAAGGER